MNSQHQSLDSLAHARGQESCESGGRVVGKRRGGAAGILHGKNCFQQPGFVQPAYSGLKKTEVYQSGIAASDPRLVENSVAKFISLR
jgi:hypothetical protein